MRLLELLERDFIDSRLRCAFFALPCFFSEDRDLWLRPLGVVAVGGVDPEAGCGGTDGTMTASAPAPAWSPTRLVGGPDEEGSLGAFWLTPDWSPTRLVGGPVEERASVVFCAAAGF